MGSDIEQGQQILSAGQRLGPSELGILATAGITVVRCYAQPVVGVMSTGNEVSFFFFFKIVIRTSVFFFSCVNFFSFCVYEN